MGDVAVVAVAGVAGSGKSTLGRALAVGLGLPLLDLDAVTNPLLDRLVGRCCRRTGWPRRTAS